MVLGSCVEQVGNKRGSKPREMKRPASFQQHIKCGFKSGWIEIDNEIGGIDKRGIRSMLERR